MVVAAAWRFACSASSSSKGNPWIRCFSCSRACTPTHKQQMILSVLAGGPYPSLHLRLLLQTLTELSAICHGEQSLTCIRSWCLRMTALKRAVRCCCSSSFAACTKNASALDGIRQEAQLASCPRTCSAGVHSSATPRCKAHMLPGNACSAAIVNTVAKCLKRSAPVGEPRTG